MATRLHISQADRLRIVQERISQYNIRFPNAVLSEKLKVDAGNISNMLNGKKPISDNFFTSFVDAYPEKSDSNMHFDGSTNYVLLIGKPNITLEDFIKLQEERIKELKKDKEWMQSLINSGLLKISTDQQYALAYQKAWVDYEAEKVSKGNKKLKAEVMYKMNKLVDGIIQNDASKDIPDETDT